MLQKVVYAAARCPSFAQASEALWRLAETRVSRERVQRWSKRVGEERVAAIDALAEAYQALPLPAQSQSPRTQIPAVACVQVDGGRLQMRTRQPSADDEDGQGHWRESLVGCLLSMTSKTSEADPCPQVPKTFVDPQRMAKISREIKGFSSPTDNSPSPIDEAPDERPNRPQSLVRSVVATSQGAETLGPRLIAAAHARGFNEASRKAFVADGSSTNWGLHAKYFSHYTPILDFTHAICYVYAAAMAGRSAAQGWEDYVQWAQWLWAGQTDDLIAAVQRRSAELGLPSDHDSETSPPQIVAKSLGYLQNQSSRMRYAAYRKLGLPISSSHIESTIKQLNRRMKGTEKFWDQGAEPLLQLVADHLSETQDLDRFWKQRPNRIPSTRCYQTAA